MIVGSFIAIVAEAGLPIMSAVAVFAAVHAAAIAALASRKSPTGTTCTVSGGVIVFMAGSSGDALARMRRCSVVHIAPTKDFARAALHGAG